MRGEHHAHHRHRARTAGSSPHARGTLVIHHHIDVDGGIIPACAGNTHLHVFRPISHADHPRMRGEHCRILSRGVTRGGSSPHARGTLRHIPPPAIITGIIPACAGNTTSAHTVSCRRWDHPRMRGEHGATQVDEFVAVGSSPHARGTPMNRGVDKNHSGIIPACAGNTGISLTKADADRDHPRMRGEHYFPYAQASYFLGSSPHARGTPFLFLRR